MISRVSLLALVPALALAAPTVTVKRSSETCAQYGEIQTGSFTVYNDLWGEGGATSGQQCTTVTSSSGSKIEWSTSYTWTGGNGIKSYANAGLDLTSIQLSKITSIPTTWDWTYTGSNLIADVAYDIFFSATSGGSASYEIMVWLDAVGGAGPISAAYGSNGQPSPIATVTIGGVSWHLYKGTNSSWTVFSFLPASGSAIESFSGDLNQFFTYLINSQGVSSSQYLTTLQAGSEATTGTNAVFTVSSYSVSLET